MGEFVKQFNKVLNILKFLEKQNKSYNKITVISNSIKYILKTGNTLSLCTVRLTSRICRQLISYQQGATLDTSNLPSVLNVVGK